MSETSIRIDLLSSGQTRPYGPSVWEARMTFSFRWLSTIGLQPGSWKPTEAQAKATARTFVRNWANHPGPFDARLVTLKEETPGVWYVVIEEPYDD